MHENSRNFNSEKLKAWLDDLACPVCFAALQFSESNVLCMGCGRSYPVVDGIPVLIPQRASILPK
jgi:uncharacterized protein YbaR (Trm112 family)